MAQRSVAAEIWPTYVNGPKGSAAVAFQHVHAMSGVIAIRCGHVDEPAFAEAMQLGRPDLVGIVRSGRRRSKPL